MQPRISTAKQAFLAVILIGLGGVIFIQYSQLSERRIPKLPTESIKSLSDYEQMITANEQLLQIANSRIKELEAKLESLEIRLPKIFPKTESRNYLSRKRILITGGAGFVGSHLVDTLMAEGHEVIVADNFFTGRKHNVAHWIGHENFELLHHDVVNPLHIEVDEIYHLASPASPRHYMYNPVKTIKTNTVGTINMLGLARRVNAKILIASSSEVYGDPDIHPQPETYWGHVNPIGPRACYDEGKRVSETLSYAYMKQEKTRVRVARIFNTYGPRMHMNDGRVVSNFILQALQNDNITVYGSGKQTRSFQYVSDLVIGLVSLMNSNYSLPINIGNPVEHTILDGVVDLEMRIYVVGDFKCVSTIDFATIIKDLVGSGKIVNLPEIQDDPQRRRPDITRAREILGWTPQVALIDGLEKTVEYFKDELTLYKYNKKNKFRLEPPETKQNKYNL